MIKDHTQAYVHVYFKIRKFKKKLQKKNITEKKYLVHISNSLNTLKRITFG